MSSRSVPWVAAAFLCLLVALVWLISGAAPPSAATIQNARAIPPADRLAEQHFVSPEQLVQTSNLPRLHVAGFAALTSDGQLATWKQLSAGRPLVVVFIRAGCPCSVKFEPVFHRLEQGHRPAVQFVGVIDAPLESARAYVQDNHVPYPVLADPEHKLIELFQAKNAAYVALVDRDGYVASLWPGCSAEMMRDLNEKAARLAGRAVPTFDATEMPGPLTTGCPF